MSNVEKSRCNIYNGGVFHLLFKYFYVFLLLKRRFLFNNQHQLCLMLLSCVFRVLNIGIKIMQWRIAVGVRTFRKAPFLRRKLVFGSYSFYPVFYSSYILHFRCL